MCNARCGSGLPRLSPAQEQRKPPGRELEGQVVVLLGIGDMKTVGHHFQKSRRGQCGSLVAVKRAHIKKNLVTAHADGLTHQRGIIQQAVAANVPLGNQLRAGYWPSAAIWNNATTGY